MIEPFCIKKKMNFLYKKGWEGRSKVRQLFLDGDSGGGGPAFFPAFGGLTLIFKLAVDN
jgi:hypothetical protein